MNPKLTVVRGTNSKPASSEALARFFAERTEYEGQVFIGFPVLSAPEGRYPIDALFISRDNGVVIFDLIEGNDPGEYEERQDDAANVVEAKLKAHRELTSRRDLLVKINTVSFAPAVADTGRLGHDGYAICNAASLKSAIDGFKWDAAENLFEATLSAIQSISTIRKSRSKRIVKSKDSRGAKLKRLEDSIATLDSLQSKAVIETTDGVQRIRGLAGSGKTIVLALKAAYLHAQHPEWRIAVTFNTRSLKDQFRRLINTFSIEQTGEEPDWENLRIVSAWGAPGGSERDGIYHEFCRVHDLPYYDFQSARRGFGRGDEFAHVCQDALERVGSVSALYDVILVDEGQDFSPAFLRLCYAFLNEKKRLVYAYDELQNLAGEAMPPLEAIFGANPKGSPRVRLDESWPGESQRDIILGKCYRNSRPVLTTAHALGFGIYRQPPGPRTTGLVQMFDNPQLWEEIGYSVKSGELKDGTDVVLRRTEETSPKFLEEHSPIDDLIQFKRFESEDAQAEWVIEAIRQNLEMDELRHDDIMVINPDPLTTANKVGLIRRKLLEMGVNSHLAGVTTGPDVFFQPEAKSVTFTGIYRAKGNEAGMVYIINGQDCQTSAFNLAGIRNRLFTAISRSKAWVRVLGVGEDMDRLIEEFEKLKGNGFELRFKYPSEKDLRHLRIVHRDITPEEQRHIELRKRGLSSIIEDLEAGTLQPEDLGDDLVRKLSELVKKTR
jgi:superfamily I DNA and RNA helicase